MTARSTMLAVFLPFLLVACGGGGETPVNNAAASEAGDYVARMQALNEKERSAVLFRAIRDAGRTCQGVVRSAPVSATGGTDTAPSWVATCDDGGQWLVALGANGVATVTGAR